MRKLLAIFRCKSLLKAALASSAIHALALSALAYVAVNSEQLPRFLLVRREPTAGQQVVLEFRMSQPAPDAPPVPEVPAVDSPVVVTPDGAVVQQHVYLDKTTAEVMNETPTIRREPEVAQQVQTLRKLAEVERQSKSSELSKPAPAPQEASEPPHVERTQSVSRPSPAAIAQQIGVQRSATIHNHRPPRYPDLAKRNRWGGRVLLKISIAADGTVSHVQVVRSSGHELLDGEAVSAVKIWVFSPALHNGQPVASQEQQEIIFTP